MPLQSWRRAWNCAIVPMADGAMLPDRTDCGVFLDLRGARSLHLLDQNST
jgi:hypothetical protein